MLKKPVQALLSVGFLSMVFQVSFKATKRSFKSRIRVPSSCGGLKETQSVQESFSAITNIRFEEISRTISFETKYHRSSCNSPEYPSFFSVS